ncbi:MAG: response regulator transcription factor [Anaerolineae bacterium]
MTIHVLLIEDATLDQAKSLAANLEDQGYQVSTTHSPEAAVECTKTLWPNLIIVNSPQSILHFSALKAAIDQTKLKIPCVVIGDKHPAHQINSDTIVVSPDKPQQLNQSVKKATSLQKDRFIRLPGLVIDTFQGQVLRDSQVYSLTPKEFKLLCLLVQHHDQILSRKTIMQEVWETNYLGDTRTLDVHIRWIREKIEENPSRPVRLMTIRGLGYRFILNPE